MNQPIIIQGFPYDDKSSYMRGTAQAPSHIREILNNGASNYFAENGQNIEETAIKDMGDFAIADYFDVEKVTAKHLEPAGQILTLGGDHSLTYPILKAFANFYSHVDILHFDAHADLYDEYEGDKYSHACPFARIMENKLASRLVSVGIRTLNTHQKKQAERFGVEIVEMKEFSNWSLPEFKNPVYISLDMDGFDPAFAPGVSHHEPGGLSSRQVIDIIQKINSKVIGADIVEYNPKRDVQDITGVLAAKMMKEILGKMMEL